MSKKRIDLLIYEKGLVDSRQKAKVLVMAGRVTVNGTLVDKPSQLYSDDVQVEIAQEKEYSSRGGLKLEKALQEFQVSVEGLEIIDIGASTGGFTDCLLKNDAAKVYSIDVGYGQLDWKLRNDERVVVMERTNARYLRQDDIGKLADGAVMDVSFISIKNIFPALERCLKQGSFIISLVKPQFEAGRDKVGKKGIIRDKNVHLEVLSNICKYIKENTRYNVINVDFSPITGQKGNIEYLIYCCDDQQAKELDIQNVVNKSHISLPNA